MRCGRGAPPPGACRAVVRGGLAARAVAAGARECRLFLGISNAGRYRTGRRGLPRWPQVLVVRRIAAYCAAACAAVPTPPCGRAGCGCSDCWGCAASVGRADSPVWPDYGGHEGRVRDLGSSLPPCRCPRPHALLAPFARMARIGTRVGKPALHRRANQPPWNWPRHRIAAFDAAVPFLGPAPEREPGAGDAVDVLAAGCGLLRLIVNNGLVLAAVKGSDPSTRLRAEIAGAEAVYGSAAELALSLLVTVAAARAGLTVVYALPLVIPLQRSLRHAQLVAEARIDAKTGLLNDRTWRRRAEGEVARAVRTRTPVAVGILDIDHFKRVNDTYGHPAGDAVLAAVAATMRATLRGYDVIGRTGGEEFAFILPGAPAAEAAEVGERLRRAVAQLQLPPGQGPGVTVSVGIAVTARPDGELLRLLLSRRRSAVRGQAARPRRGVDSRAGPEADDRPRPFSSVRARRLVSGDEWVRRAELGGLLRACRARRSAPRFPAPGAAACGRKT